MLSLQLIKQNLVFLQDEKGLLLEVLTGETQGGSKSRSSTHSFTVLVRIPELTAREVRVLLSEQQAHG